MLIIFNSDGLGEPDELTTSDSLCDALTELVIDAAYVLDADTESLEDEDILGLREGPGESDIFAVYV